jgi:hypothetical protein
LKKKVDEKKVFYRIRTMMTQGNRIAPTPEPDGEKEKAVEGGDQIKVKEEVLDKNPKVTVREESQSASKTGGEAERGDEKNIEPTVDVISDVIRVRKMVDDFTKLIQEQRKYIVS